MQANTLYTIQLEKVDEIYGGWQRRQRRENQNRIIGVLTVQYNKTIKITDLIDFLKTQKKTLTYCVYGKGSSDQATLETDCVLDESSEITDDDEEIFPKYIIQNNLEFWFTDELLEDVTFNALKQKISATNEEILIAIKHYNERDSFMKL